MKRSQPISVADASGPFWRIIQNLYRNTKRFFFCKRDYRVDLFCKEKL